MGAPFQAGAAALVESSSNEHLLIEQTTERDLTVRCCSHVGMWRSNLKREIQAVHEALEQNYATQGFLICLCLFVVFHKFHWHWNVVTNASKLILCTRHMSPKGIGGNLCLCLSLAVLTNACENWVISVIAFVHADCNRTFSCDCVLVLFCNDLAITKYFITVPINHVAPRLVENMLSRFCTQLKTYLVPSECFKGAETQSLQAIERTLILSILSGAEVSFLSIIYEYLEVLWLIPCLVVITETKDSNWKMRHANDLWKAVKADWICLVQCLAWTNFNLLRWYSSQLALLVLPCLLSGGNHSGRNEARW